MSVIGFDIGSENAVIAIARNNGIDIVLNEASSRATPVLVSFQGKQRHIGAAAEPLTRSNYKNTVGELKRFIGRKYSEASVQRELKGSLLVHKALDGDEIGFKVMYNDKEEWFTPTQLMSMVLGKLKTTVEVASGGRATNVVISVPTYYTETQRRCMVDASEIAGMRCLRLINEPVAVALAYGYPKSVKKQLDAEKPLVVMFADMGYTDFTVSIVEYFQGKMIVKGTAFDRNCGGHDVDTAIVGYLIEQSKAKTKLDCSTNPKSVMSLYRVAEKAKKTLSPYGVDTVAVNSECLFQDRDLATHLDIATFNKLCENLVPKIAKTVEQCLVNAKMSIAQVTDVEMVGGSLRVRWAKEALAKATNRKVDDLMAHLNQDEACSRGCALQCAILSPGVRMHEFEMQDVVPYPINLSWQGSMDAVTDDKTEQSIQIYGFGATTPFTRRVTFARNADFTVKAVYDDAAKPNLNEGSTLRIGEYTIKGVPAANENGSVPKIRVTMQHDANGCFLVTKAEYMKEVVKEAPKEGEAEGPKEGEEEVEEKGAAAKKTYKPVPLTVVSVRSGALTPEGMVAAQAKEAKMAAQDRELVEKDAKKNELETYVYDTRDKLAEKFKAYVDSATADQFNALLDETESWLYSDEGYDGTLALYQSKVDALRKIGDPISARYSESQERPIAVSEYNDAVENAKRWLNKQGIDEAFYHLSDEDWASVRNAAKDAKSWIQEEQYKHGALPLTQSSGFTAGVIRSKVAEFNKLVNPIMNKPKPKEPTKVAVPNPDAEKPAEKPAEKAATDDKEINMDVE